MNTVQLTKQPVPTNDLSRLSVLDRLALHWGLAMIAWADRPHRTHESFAPDAFDAIEHSRELIQARDRAGRLR